jgi:hypothetical protein
VVAERAQSTVRNEEEQSVVCESLALMAEVLSLPEESAVARRLFRALHAREAALREFCAVVRAAAPGRKEAGR